MPPKKAVKEEKAMLGRPSNNLKIGVVGLPNVGKSTFFNALTNASAAAENYPFCTIGKFGSFMLSRWLGPFLFSLSNKLIA